jgi:acylphosphatase
MQSATTLVFLGRFEPASFTEFVHHRARRLELTANLGAVDCERIEVQVAGDEALVDAFEMACSLGPIDCLVLDTYRARRAARQRVAGLPT